MVIFLSHGSHYGVEVRYWTTVHMVVTSPLGTAAPADVVAAATAAIKLHNLLSISIHVLMIVKA